MTLTEHIEKAQPGVTIISRYEDYAMVTIEVIKDQRVFHIHEESDYLTLDDLKANDWMVQLHRPWRT